MIINGQSLLDASPIRCMVTDKVRAHGRSFGLSEVGYDFRMKQRVEFIPPNLYHAFELAQQMHASAGFTDSVMERYKRYAHGYTIVHEDSGHKTVSLGRTALASSVEFFDIPTNLWCEFRNKSTNARHHIDAALGTDGEPGWSGHLTIELIFNGLEPIDLPAGVPILKAVFHEIKNKAKYEGKYQDQPDRPVSAIHE